MALARYPDVPRPCADGYIRLKLKAFLLLPFEDRKVWEDAPLCADLAYENIPALRAGYCEWASKAGGVVVSLGWIWYEDASRTEAVVAADGISSNVMLLDRDGDDLGFRKTSALLQGWLLSQPWQQGVAAARASENGMVMVSALPH